MKDVKDFKDVWVFTEIKDHVKVHDCALEILAKGRELADELGQKLVAIVLALDAEQYLQTIEEQGVDKIIYISHQDLKHYHEKIFTSLVYDLIEKDKPSIFLFPSTEAGNALAARLAYRCCTGLVSNVLNFEFVKGESGENLLMMEKPAYSGNVHTKIVFPHSRPQMCTVTTGTFQKKKIKRENIEKIKIDYNFDTSTLKLKIIGNPTRKDKPSSVLSDAKFVIGGGEGLDSKANFDKLYELANLSNGQVGGTRRTIINGWIPGHLQIGISGVTIFPDVYLAFGISGAIQHIVGTTESKKIIAVNKDAKAPIFEAADYCIIADAEEILDGLLRYFRV